MEVINGREFLENSLKGEVVDLNNPTCCNCNECCSRITSITEEDYKRIKKFLTTTEGKKIYAASINRIIKHQKNNTLYMICPFSNEKNKCTIYGIRPQICKDFHCSPKYNKVLERPTGEGLTINDFFKR